MLRFFSIFVEDAEDEIADDSDFQNNIFFVAPKIHNEKTFWFFGVGAYTYAGRYGNLVSLAILLHYIT